MSLRQQSLPSTPRVEIYARYSSENQREASIEDQIRICRERMVREGWTLANVFRDHAVSGATTLRPGYRRCSNRGAHRRVRRTACRGAGPLVA